VNPSSRSCKIDWKIQIGIQKLEIEKEKEKNIEKKEETAASGPQPSKPV
jgi:hypothetical protein